MGDEVATYLGAKGYTILKECLAVEEQEAIRRDLTVKPFVPKSSMAKPSPFPVYRESRKKFYIPRFYGCETYGRPDASRIGDGEAIDLEFQGKLKPIQRPIVKKYLEWVAHEGAGLLELYCGMGKTVMALWIIAALGRKTLVVVHKEFLLRQWEERIAQFLPNARVGRIQGPRVETEDKDIVIGMLQSLSMKDYGIETFQQFGLTIIDEVHHIAAEVFSRALFRIVTRYMLGLSATMKRKDGLTHVFKMFLGDVVCKKERKGNHAVVVKAINFLSDEPEFSKVEYNWRGQTHYAIMIKKLCEFNRRSEFVLRVLCDVLQQGASQQVIILGHNKSLLKYLHDAIKHRSIASVGFYVGGMKEKDLKISETKQVIIATYAMASEGLDIKTLTTLIMATPKSDVEQSVGRILRGHNSKPLVVDIVDKHGIFQRQWIKRRRWYKKQKFRVLLTDSARYGKNEWEEVKGRGKMPSHSNVSGAEGILRGMCLLKAD